MTNIDLPATFEVELPNSAGKRTIELAKLPASTLTYLFAYGLRQCVADAGASAKAFAADADNKCPDVATAAGVLCDKRIARLIAGTMTQRESSDPLSAEVRRLLAKALGAKAWDALSKEDRAAKVAKVVAGKGLNEAATALRNDAVTNVAKASKIAKGADLGL